MNEPEEGLIIDLDPQTINSMSRLMADSIIQIALSKPEAEALSLDLIASSTAGVLDPLGQLRDWFISVFNSVSSWIVSGVTTFINQYVTPAINALASGITSLVNNIIIPAITSLGSTVTDFITSRVIPTILNIPTQIGNFFTQTVIPAITGWFNTYIAPALTQLRQYVAGTIIPALTALPSQITSFISGTIIPAFTAGIQSLSSFISQQVIPALATIPATLSSALREGLVPIYRGLTVTLPQVFALGLAKASQEIASGIAGFINTAIGGLSSSISGFIQQVTSGINTIVSNVTAGFQSVANIFTGFVNAIMTFPQWFPNWFMETIAKPISEALSKLGDWIWNALPDWLRNAISALGDFFTKTLPQAWDTFVKGLQDFISDPLGWIDKNVIKPLMSGLKAIGDWIWNALPAWFKEILLGIQKRWDDLVSGVQSFFADPLGWLNKNLVEPLVAGLKSVADWFSQAFKNFSEATEKGWEAITKGLQDFTSDPWGWFNKNLLQPIMGGLNWVWEQLVNAGKSVWGWMLGVGKWLSDAFNSAVNWIVGLGQSFVKFVYDGLTNLAKEIGEWVNSIVQEVPKEVSKTMGKYFKPVIGKTFDELGIKTPEELKLDTITEQLTAMTAETTGALLIPLFGQLLPRLITRIAMAGSKFFKGLEWKWHLNLKPWGIGIETNFDIGKALGSSIYVWGQEIMSWLRIMGDSYANAWGFWLARPQVRLLTYTFRNVIPIELPPQNDIVEFARRVLPIEAKEDVFDMAKFFLAIYGYSNWVLDMYFEPKDKYVLKVKDRFGNERKVPLSLLYELPSASDVATMMVRDIFPDIEEFRKLYLARGMHEDIGALYYYMRFRYPPPERLWQYTTRGISGFLWATLTSDMRKKVEEEAGEIKAKSPVDSYSLNFKADKLLNAFQNYMKWHDYAMFSWMEGFTSDNQIIIDTQADIPTKIDQRWMARFGIYELLSTKGVGMSSPIDEFRTKVVETTPASKIQMDLTLLSRGLQATGLHPDLVPVTAVAETINAISDERNMLRTASLSLFKEGFWNTDAIEKLLAGTVVASFKVASFDTDTLKWETNWINIPLMFLPPERKLVETRAIMDRAMDILKDIQRDISTAYQEYIILDYEAYKKTLTDVIDRVNTFFASDYEKIVGKPLPDELKLKFVEEYYKPYVEALETFRTVHIVRRIRAWTQRWLGWIMYRVATGVASLQDTEELIKITSQRAMLSKIEVDFLQEVMRIMYNIATREYIPTPSQLLTMSEYVSIPSELIDKVFQARFMSPEWAGIWKQYINVRTIADDVKSLISTYMYVLRYVKVPDEVTNVVKDYAKKIGFGDEELKLFDLRAQIEEMLLNSRQNVREYIPSPSMLASMAEYLPEVREFYPDVVKAKGIPEAWQPLWAKYIDIRPLVNDVKTYLSRAEQLYARFMITEEDFKKVLAQVKDYLGYTDKEIEFLMLTTRFERHRTAWTELIGDVDRMVMLAEYSPKAREFALGTLYKMIDALPIEQDTKNVLKKMWEDFIRIKPVKEEVISYVRDLINLYVAGQLSDSAFSNELEALREWGLDDYEIMFYKAMASMRRAKKLKIYVG